MPPSAEQLVVLAQRHDASAFSQLIAQHERLALAVAFAVTADADLAGDVVQESFLRAWQRLAELREPAKFSGWLCNLVRHLAIDFCRKVRRRSSQPLDESTAATGGDPFQETAAREENQQLAAALATLDEITRAAVMLRYYENLSSREIAPLLDLTPAGVDMRLSRARQLLKQKLTPPSLTPDSQRTHVSQVQP